MPSRSLLSYSSKFSYAQGGKALPRPLPRALRAKMNIIRTLFYWEGFGKVLPSPGKIRTFANFSNYSENGIYESLRAGHKLTKLSRPT